MSNQPTGSSKHRRHLLAYIPTLLVFLLLAAVLSYGVAHSILPPDGIQRADALLMEGQYYMALHQYRLLAAQGMTPDLSLRLGILRAIRGEWAEAEQLLWGAAGADLDGRSQALSRLYLGHVLASRGQLAEAQRVWQEQEQQCEPPADCAYASYQRIVQAEWLLHSGDYQSAEVRYRSVLSATLTLPADWYGLLAYRVAFLVAATDSPGALALLDTPVPGEDESVADPFVAPLLPPGIAYASGQLRAVLLADPVDRTQLLGQLYLQSGYDALALQQFERVTDDSPHGLSAHIFAAYVRWRMGDRQAGLAQLKELVARQRHSIPVQTLLALAYLHDPALLATATLSQTIAALPPDRSETYLVWAAWYVAQSDYVQASGAYQRALKLAPANQRGRYALLVARFHLNTTYELCTEGLPVAAQAAQLLPDDTDALTTLAASHYQCGEFAAAVTAAQHVLNYAERADASFYLGAALAQMGKQEEARTRLIRAADLAPTSIWRERSEEILSEFRL